MPAPRAFGKVRLPMELLTEALSFILQPCYDISHNWWIAILLFTVIVKIILIPMSLWCQKNSIVMVQLMPELNRIKAKYFGDRETIGEKQNDLYKEKHYHPLLSLIPLAVQILILFGLVDVIHTITDYGAPGTEFLGMIPVEDGGASWLMPLLAGLSAVVMGYAQNRINPLQREQSKAEKNMTNGLSIALSFFLGIFVAAGMAFYWICSNLTSIAVQALCNVIIKPKKYIDYEDLQQSRIPLEELNALSGDRPKWYQHDPLSKREKADYKRFFSIVNKHIVFYSEGSGFYKYFKGAIEYLLANSDTCIHYVTNDPNDQIFEIAKTHPRILPYFIGEKKLITLMMKMDADIVVTTLEDLETYYIKRSYVRKDIEYVFMFHHMSSTTLVAQKTAYDHYDTILCAGPHQVEELRAAEKLRGLPQKNLVECGYDLMDEEISSFENLARDPGSKPVILVAPSWQEDCLLDSCFADIVDNLLAQEKYRVVVRPHPEYIKRFKPRWEKLIETYSNIPESKLIFEKDFSSNTSIFSSDVIIADWSSVAFEFSFATCKPSLFVNTKMKVKNPDYMETGIVPTDISWRDELGVSLEKDEVASRIVDAIDDMVANQDAWKEKIASVRAQAIFNIGHGGEAAGEYLLSAILKRQKETEAGDED